MPAISSVTPMIQRIWVGLDTGDETSAMCVTDNSGTILIQCDLPSKAVAVHRWLNEMEDIKCFFIAMESCSTSMALAKGLRAMGYNVELFDCLQVHRFLSIRKNKTDTNDARGIAEIGRLGGGHLTAVYVKSNECFLLRSKLVTRHRIMKQRVACENALRGLLRVYGAKIRRGVAAGEVLASAVREQVDIIRKNDGVDLSAESEPLLNMCLQFYSEAARLRKEIARFADENEHCRRFQEVPGVSALVAVSFYTAITDPHRFSRATDVPAYLGLTPKVFESGATSQRRSISKAGNTLTRTHLVNAAFAILHTAKVDTALRRWGVEKAASIGARKARVAVARKLAIILFNIWRHNAVYQPNGAVA